MNVSEPSPLNDEQVRNLAAAVWADLDRRLSGTPDPDPTAIAARSVADVLYPRNACRHGFAAGAFIRPDHGTPACPFCRRAYVAGNWPLPPVPATGSPA